MGKDIPIIFSGPMVRALLDGRKTMTRRILKDGIPTAPGIDNVNRVENIRHDLPYFDAYCSERKSPENPRGMSRNWCWWTRDDRQCLPTVNVKYAPGDRLWVRENVACGACAPSAPSTWAPSFWRREQGTPSNPSGLWYQADGLSPANPITDRGRWVSSIHMPRWASRLTLPVDAVKIERLQDISEDDARAEGAIAAHFSEDDGKFFEAADGSFRTGFAGLWSHLHGADGWDANPFVVAITFRVIKANIDAPKARAAA